MDYNSLPIHEAITNLESNDILSELILTNDINAIDEENYTPLLLALEYGFKTYLSNVGSQNITDKFNFLKEKFFKEKQRIIKFLLDNGADVNICNIYNQYPLLYVIKYGNFSENVALRILDKTKDLKGINIYCNEYLITSIISGKEKIALELIDRGINIETTKTNRSHHHSALIYSVIKGLKILTSKLLSMNIDIFVPSFLGDHLFCMVKYGHKSEEILPVIKQMIKREFGINYVRQDLSIKKRFGGKNFIFKTFDKTDIELNFEFSMIYFCVKYKLESFALLLLDYITPNCMDFTITIRKAIRNNMNIFVIKMLSKYGQDTRILNVNYVGNTIMHEIIYLNNTILISYLLTINFDSSIKNNKNISPMDILTSNCANLSLLKNFYKNYHLQVVQQKYYYYKLRKTHNTNNSETTAPLLITNTNKQFKELDNIIIQYSYSYKESNYILNYDYKNYNNAIEYLLKNYDYYLKLVLNQEELNKIIKQTIVNSFFHLSHSNALRIAIKLKITEIAIFLIDSNYDVNSQNKKKVSPLSLAIKTSNITVIDKLLSHKEININIQMKNGFTPLLLAIRKNLNTVVEKLLNLGCDVMIQLKSNKQFDIMIEKQAYRAAILYYEKFRISKIDVNNINFCPSSTNNWDQLFSKIVKYQHFELAEKIIDDNVALDPKILIKTLINLLSNSQINLVNKIINNYPNINVRNADKNGNTMLHKSISKGFHELSRSLIFKGAKVNKNNYHGKTPMMISENKGYKDIIENYLTEFYALKNSSIIKETKKTKNIGFKRTYDAIVEGDDFISIKKYKK